MEDPRAEIRANILLGALGFFDTGLIVRPLIFGARNLPTCLILHK